MEGDENTKQSGSFSETKPTTAMDQQVCHGAFTGEMKTWVLTGTISHAPRESTLSQNKV
jgi:hypothetical protein